MDELLEVLAERSHIGWMKEKQAQGFADHVFGWEGEWQPNGGCWDCSLPRDRHHPDMLPYADLSESVKEYDRATVRGVLDGIRESGYVVISGDQWRTRGAAIGLLNSMVLSGEDHSDLSRQLVRDALV